MAIKAVNNQVQETTNLQYVIYYQLSLVEIVLKILRTKIQKINQVLKRDCGIKKIVNGANCNAVAEFGSRSLLSISLSRPKNKPELVWNCFSVLDKPY